MAMELAMESNGVSHGEDEDDILMADETEESIDTSPSDGFTAITNEHSASISVKNIDMNYPSTPSNGVSKKAMSWRKKSGKRKTNSGTTTTINEYYMSTSGITVINMPDGNIASNGTRDDFYTTPDNNAHKDDGTGRIYFDKKPLDCGTKCCSAKTATSRALEFSDPVPNEDEEFPNKFIPAEPKTGKRQSNQSQIQYRHRKRKNKAGSSTVGKRPHHGGGEHRRIRNSYNFNIAKNEGELVVGKNINIFIGVKEIKNELGEAEEVEADGSCSSVRPKRSLKVQADETFVEFTAVFQDIINRLHPLRDKGKHKEFYSEAKSIAKARSTEQHIQILIMIEESITLSYEKEFAKSQEIIDEVNKMISKTGVKMKNFLITYSYIHQTGLSRRQNRLTEADKCVTIARQNEEFIPFGISRVFVVYEEASNRAKMLSIMNVTEEEPWQNWKEDARKSLRECISLSKRIHEENGSIYLQRDQFCLLKLALINLNCRTKTSRTQPVDEESIDEAERCINEMEECEGNMSEALSVQFYTAKSDLCFRRKDFLQAGHFAQQALGIAQANNISLEIKAIEERLEDI